MKIKYNILWVEDDKSWYNTKFDNYRDTLEENGFELVSDRKDSIQDVSELIKDNGLQKYDMLLVDFTLKNSETGDEIIKLIRNNKIYTDVIFYSSSGIEDIKKSINKHGLEGVYTTDRKLLDTKFRDIFLTTIKKIQEINTMRGLIMGETSELDVEIENLVMLIVEKQEINEEELRKIVTNKVFTKLCEKEKNFWKKYQDFISYFPKIDAIKKWEILRELFKSFKLESDDICELLKTNKAYQEEVIEVRNMFAHVKAVEENGKLILRGKNEKKDIVFDDEKCVEIRHNLIKHRKCLENMEKILNNK